MAHHRHFLLADDDDLMRSFAARQLAGIMDCTVSEAASVAEVLAATTRGIRLDAILLDVRLPDGDGRDLCQLLRRDGHNMPVLMLTGLGRESDVVRGLDAGANDYIVKPYRVAELAARLRAQMRAFETSEHAEVTIGPYVFRPGAKQLQVPGSRRPIRLTEKEAAVLKFLYRANGAAVAREVLLHKVWGYSADASTHTVETHIYRLRRKIESMPDTARLLVNDGGGYRLCLDRPSDRPPHGRAQERTRITVPAQLAFSG